MATIPGGVIGAPVTPFTPDDEVDLPRLAELCDQMVADGMHGVALPLHTGESVSLSVEERRAVVECAAEAIAGRVPMLVHVSMPGTREAVALAEHAEAAGASAVIAVTPYHWRPSPQGLEQHYRALASAVSIGVMAYNFPSRLGVSLAPETLERLIQTCPNFVGVKDASYDMQSFTEACRRTAALRPDFAMMTGVEYLLPSMTVGGAGCFSPMAALAPRLVLDLWAACVTHDWQVARELQHVASALWRLLRELGYPASVKAALALRGLPVGSVRSPLTDLTPSAREHLAACLDQLLAVPSAASDERCGGDRVLHVTQK